MKGLVIKNTGSCYVVRTESGIDVNCKIKGNFRLRGIRTTNPVAVGDVVEISSAAAADDVSYITAIDERRNYIIRRASNLSKESHIIAANIDYAFLIVTIREPETSTTFIDRFLATAEAYGVKAVIVVNKMDLLDDEEREYADALAYLYRSIGYEVIMMSAAGGDADDGVSKILELASGHVSLFSGNSGVGKSTIINLLLPGVNLKVGSISASHHTGMHTTTFSEMFQLPGGGYIIDTPGIKGFGTIDFDKGQVAHYFPEIFRVSADCRYYNCTHTHEPGCAVREAVEQSLISESRYTSYLSILEDSSDSKYRKGY